MVFGKASAGNMSGGAKHTADDAIPVPEALSQISLAAANELVKCVRTEQDLWWFVMEQFDRLSSSSSQSVRQLMQLFPLRLHAVEYEGRRSENSYVGQRNSGVAYLYDQVMPSLSNRFGEEIAEMTIAHAFSQYCLAYLIMINRVRLSHAVHFHNNCISSHSYSFADRWTQVIESLGGD